MVAGMVRGLIGGLRVFMVLAFLVACLMRVLGAIVLVE